MADQITLTITKPGEPKDTMIELTFADEVKLVTAMRALADVIQATGTVEDAALHLAGVALLKFPDKVR